jgi:phosphohistidine phosphatase
MEHGAHGLKALGIAPRVVLASPLRRAQETAAILQGIVAPRASLETCAGLAPGTDPAALVRELKAYRGVEELALVGHQPDMGELASFLLTGSPTTAAFEFKKGAVAAIAVATLPPHAPGLLLWFLPPKALRGSIVH